MLPSPTVHFYTELPVVTSFTFFHEEQCYQELPDDWDIVMVEVLSSPEAIADGLYKEVNALAAASIIATNNLVRKLLPGVELPSIFSGDGATLLSPRCMREELLVELSHLMTRARAGFGLDLRVGLLPAQVVFEHDKRLLVGKCQFSSTSTRALFSGDGYTFAHMLFHQDAPELISPSVTTPGAPDLDGFECRWHPIPAKRGQIVSLMVKSLDRQLNRSIYSRILTEIEEITDEHTSPLQIDQLQLSTNPSDFYIEATLRTEKLQAMRLWLYQRIALIINLIGIFLLRMGWRASDFDGSTYLAEVIQNTDYRKFDDTLRLTLDLDDEQLQELRACLDQMHSERKIVFGLHCSGSAQITCMIESHDQRHLHFIDGTDGGFACAALAMKTQLEELKHAYTSPLEPCLEGPGPEETIIGGRF